ncbi:MAG: hypothetical protein K0S37_2964 [Microbacterium sp.]|jgi:hypothetical protein|nr:hypothetical protein [Microbacterium sp.]
MNERGETGRIPVERWWPPLPIEAKHRVLAAIEEAGDADEVVLDDGLVAEIAEIDGSGEAPARLTSHERDFIRTQTEAVD